MEDFFGILYKENVWIREQAHYNDENNFCF
jgi:hypothetical protein